MQYRGMIIVGAASFIVGALAFVFVFSYLAANFNYPDILDGTAAEVLPRLRDGGSAMRAVWAVYAFLPLFLVPGAVAAYLACPSSRARMTLALVVASMGALAMCLGLMRWPSIHWTLAEAYSRAGSETKGSLDAVFSGMNLYLGNYIGEFLGETTLAAFSCFQACPCLQKLDSQNGLVGLESCFRFCSWLEHFATSPVRCRSLRISTTVCFLFG